MLFVFVTFDQKAMHETFLQLVADKTHQERRLGVARNYSRSFRGCPKRTLANGLSPWPPSCFRQAREVRRKGKDSLSYETIWQL